MFEEEKGFYSGVGLRLKEKREERGMSLQELSDLTGISKSSLQRYETGNTKKIPMDAVPKLEAALKMERGQLMGLREDTLSKELKRGELSTQEVSIRTSYAPDSNSPLVFREPKMDVFSDRHTPVGADFCVVAPDDSLIRDRIKKGDIVFINSYQKSGDGSIVLISVKGEQMLCHSFLNSGRWTFTTSETFLCPIISTDLEGDGIKILGKAVAFQSVL